MKYLSALLFILLVVSTEILPGQYYDTGQDPASLKWLQIKTSHFNIIYPEKYGSGGELYARSLEDAYSKLLAIFPERKFRIPVIIHNYTIQSNGYVAWAPKRMELYPSPEQNSIPLSPEKQLAIHELAHVFQMSSLHQGFTKILSVCLGEQISGIVAALLPAWFLEGDAVFAESALSESGRGRSPAFQKQLKALALEKDGLCKYDKILNGSYRDYVPDHYRFGYQMVTWALIKYKPDIWNNVLNYTAQSPVTGNPVNMSLRMSSGLTKKKLYRETFDTLTKIWTKELSTNGSAPYSAVNPVKKDTYTNYYSPVATGTDSIVAIRTSLSSPPAIVLIVPSKGKEKKMLTTGQIYPFDLSYGHGKILWVETESDPRWENRSYSVIRLLDISNGRVKRLTHKTRYLSVTISPDGKTISAAENSAENINRLVTIDAATGAITGSVPSPDNVSMQRPRWAADGKKIVMIFLNNEGEGIMTYSPGKRKWEILSAAGRDDLQSAVLRNDSLWFVSSHSGTDNVYLKTHDGKVTRITHSRFGCSDLSQTGNKLIFSDYTSSGNDICLVSDIESNGSINDKTFSESLLINRLAVNQDQKSDTLQKIYSAQPYKKWQHLFNFHSWMPFYADITRIQSDPASVRPGVTTMSQNQLSTLVSSVGYEYSKEKNNVLHASLTWKGWYPVIESRFDYGDNPSIYRTKSSIGYPSLIQRSQRFTNTIYLPLTFTPGKFSQYIYISASSDYRNDYIYQSEKSSYDYGQTILSARLYFSNYLVAVLRDIYPRLAQAIDINYSFAPFDKTIYGTSISAKSSFYFPGILPNNSLRIRIEKEIQNPSMYFYGSRLTTPRGYNDLISKDMQFISADYTMPVAYPDFNISQLLYLKRIRAGLFYDEAFGPGNKFYKYSTNGLVPYSGSSSNITFTSFGAELLADFHLLRIPYMISGGVEAAWYNLNQRPSVQMIFNIDLYGMTIGKRRMY